MDIDKIFSPEMPLWMQQFVAQKDYLITSALETHSKLYATKCCEKDRIYEKYPRLAQFIDNEIDGADIIMQSEEARALAELIQIQFMIMEMYQYMFLILGIVDGYELKDLMIKIMNEERTKNHDDI